MDMREYHRNYWKKRRKAIIDYLGGKCIKCASIENLQVDHIDPTKKLFNISYRCSLNQIKDELKKCQLLCKNCHKIKTIKERPGFTHGTAYGWMRKKCSCSICFGAKRKWNDDRNFKRICITGIGRGPYGLPVEHGTIRKYHRGCKCSLCKKANADNVRMLKNKKPL